LLTGTLAYFFYAYASMAFGAAYNELFLVYIALFSASLFSVVMAFTSIDARAFPSRFWDRLPRRSGATFMFVVGLVLTVVWLEPPPRLASRPATPGVGELLDAGHPRSGSWCHRARLDPRGRVAPAA